VSDEVTPEEFEVPSTVEEILDERSESEQQRDEYKDALQRLQADFENYKKRVARTSEEVVTRAVADVVAKLLPVLDALDLAQALSQALG
jgi:molecular chaperone GrpE